MAIFNGKSSDIAAKKDIERLERQKADKTLIEQAAAGEKEKLIMSDGNGKLVPSEYDINNLRILNNAISGIQKVLLETERLSNKTTSISEESTDMQYPSAKAVYDMLPKRQTIVVDTLIWDIQPTIEGSLNEAFDTWKNGAYYITLKDTDGTALSDGQFKLCTAYDGYANAIDQIFTISGKSLSENMAIDFKTISEDRTSFEMRDAGVKNINIHTKNNKSQRYVFSIFHNYMTAAIPNKTRYVYISDNIGKALSTSALYYTTINKTTGGSGFLLPFLDSKAGSFGKIGYTITMNRTHIGMNVSSHGLRTYDNKMVSYDANGYSDCSAGTEDFSNMELNQFNLHSNNIFYFRNGTSITLEEFIYEV